MTGAPAFRADEARFTPITVAGVLAIIGLSGVLAASVLQSAAGGGSLAPRIASGSARSQAALVEPSMAVTQAAVVPVLGSQPALRATSVPATGGSIAAVAGRGVVSAGTVALTQASGSSQAPTSIAAASGLTTATTPLLPSTAPQSPPAPSPAAQFTTNIASVHAATVGAASASGANALQAAQDQVLGVAATTATGASSGVDPATGSDSGSGSGVPVNTNPPFPSVHSYAGPISTEAEAMQALGLPADFQFGAEPDPYVVGSYHSFVTDAAAGDQAAQAGLNLAMSQGANFSGFN
jgi:hypothetical protein